MTIMANGGFTVVAPGGTKTIDKFFDSTGASSTSAFGATMTVTGVANAYAGMSIQLQVISGVYSTMSTTVTNLLLAATGVKMDVATIDMSSGTAEFKFKGLFFVG